MMNNEAYKSLAIKLAAFCCRIHGLSPGHCDEPVPLSVREEAMRLVREFKDLEYRMNHKPVMNWEKMA